MADYVWLALAQAGEWLCNRKPNQSRVYRGADWHAGVESRRLDFGQDRDPITKLADVHADHI